MIHAKTIYKMFKSAGLEITKAQQIKGVGMRYFLRNECKRKNMPLARCVYTIDENITKFPIFSKEQQQILELWDALKMLTQDAINEAKEKGELIDL